MEAAGEMRAARVKLRAFHRQSTGERITLEHENKRGKAMMFTRIELFAILQEARENYRSLLSLPNSSSPGEGWSSSRVPDDSVGSQMAGGVADPVGGSTWG